MAPMTAVDLRQPVKRLTQFLHIMGLWPKPAAVNSQRCGDWLPYTVYAIAFQLVFTLAYDGFKCINFLHMTDLGEITRAMFICLTELSLAVKIANFRLRMATVQAFLTDIEHGVRPRDAHETAIMMGALAFLRSVIVWFLVTANTTGVFSYLSPVLVAEPMLPYPGWYPLLDWEHSRRDYWLLWTYQVLGMFFQIQALVIIEVFFIYLMVLASAQLDVLGSRIERIGPEVSAATMERELVECMRAHALVLK